MTDHFKRLGLTPRPWLELAVVDEVYLAASSNTHPDLVHGESGDQRKAAEEASATLNQAYTCLRSPRLRLRHFLELERGAPVTDLHEIPDDLMALFMDVGKQVGSMDAAIRALEGVSSPLLKVAQFQKAQAAQETAEACRDQLQERQGELLAQLRHADEVWETSSRAGTTQREDHLRALESTFRLLTFYERWIDQLQARSLKLISLL